MQKLVLEFSLIFLILKGIVDVAQGIDLNVILSSNKGSYCYGK